MVSERIDKHELANMHYMYFYLVIVDGLMNGNNRAQWWNYILLFDNQYIFLNKCIILNLKRYEWVWFYTKSEHNNIN